MTGEGIPYPPVFRDWRRDRREARVATGRAAGGVEVQMMQPEDRPHTWRVVELAERDAGLFAASLLQRAGYGKLARRVEKAMK